MIARRAANEWRNGLRILLVSFASGFSSFIFAQTPAPFPLPTPARVPAPRNAEAQATIIIYNNLDAVSLELAAYYAEKRGIPLDHLVGVDCSQNEEISREEYDRTIAQPLRKIFGDHDWWQVPADPNSPITANRIHFVALMRGVPLKISEAPGYPGDKPFTGQPVLDHNAACIDSELAILGLNSKQISGPVKNPYYRSYTAFSDALMVPMMLVCRLDAPTPAIVRRMIDDGLAAEQNGLWGFAYLDSRGPMDGGLAEGEKWIANIAKDTREHGIPTIEDNSPALFPANYPMRNAALYFGWYSGAACGPFAEESFRFNQGAIACHIHSFSAASVRDPRNGWVAPLLVRGAAATLGNVYEPYLALTPNLDIFEERLRNGFNFAESAYMSQRVLSWMTTFVGDPLYRPFKLVQDSANSAPKNAAEWIAYRDGANVWFRKNRAAGEMQLRDAAARTGSGIIFEGLGLLEWSAAQDMTAALQAFDDAEHRYKNADDKVRVILHGAQILQSQKKTPDALALARRGIRTFPKTPASSVLRALVNELAPTPSPPPTPQASLH